MKKEIEVCDSCEDEEPEYEIVQGASKGDKLCSGCFDDWQDETLDKMYKEIK